jgi:heme oxygenase (biliverdin-IX-beta and delta-forming)
MQRLSRTLIRLNLATRQHHARADAGWLDLRRATVIKQDYIEQLVRVYGFEAPLEAALRYTPGVGAVIDLRARTRAGLIVQDLMRLGLGPGRIAALPQRFISFSTAAEALGWMYVAERATLAFSVIRHHLETRLPKEVTAAAAYLACYDGIVGARWKHFGGVLDEQAVLPGVEDRIIAAAGDAIRCQRGWIKQDHRVAIDGTSVVETRRAQ